MERVFRITHGWIILHLLDILSPFPSVSSIDPSFGRPRPGKALIGLSRAVSLVASFHSPKARELRLRIAMRGSTFRKLLKAASVVSRWSDWLEGSKQPSQRSKQSSGQLSPSSESSSRTPRNTAQQLVAHRGRTFSEIPALQLVLFKLSGIVTSSPTQMRRRTVLLAVGALRRMICRFDALRAKNVCWGSMLVFGLRLCGRTVCSYCVLETCTQIVCRGCVPRLCAETMC